MQRALYISLISYFLLLLAAAGAFWADFHPDRLASPLALTLFSLWLGDGLASLVIAIVILRRILRRIYPLPDAAILASLALLTAGLGLPPVYILIELAYKLILYLQLQP